MNKLIYTICLIAPFYQAWAQGLPGLDESAYFDWKSIRNAKISDHGRWVSYEVSPNKGDGFLVLYNTFDGDETKMARSVEARFDTENQKLIYKIVPSERLIDSLEHRGVDKEDMPRDSLVIYDLEQKTAQTIPNVKSYKQPEKWSGWLFVSLEANRDSILTDAQSRKMDDDEFVFLICNLKTNEIDSIPYVESFVLAEESPRAYLHRNTDDSTGVAQVLYYDMTNDTLRRCAEVKGTILNLTTSSQGDVVSFYSDTSAQEKDRNRTWDFHLCTLTDTTIAMTNIDYHSKLPQGWNLSTDRKLRFSPEGRFLYFGTSPRPFEGDTTRFPSEIPEVEIWHYQDQILYTQQKVKVDEEQKRSYLYAYDVTKRKIIELGKPTLPEIRVHPKIEVEHVLGFDDRDYRKTISWEGRSYRDVHLVSLQESTSKRIATRISGTPRWSPAGHYLYWYEEPDSTWYLYDLEEQKQIDLTRGQFRFYDELNDVPDHPDSYGLAGWIEDDEGILLYDRYDVWLFNLKYSKEVRRLTKGRESQIVYRIIDLDTDIDYIHDDRIFVRGFNENTKEEFYGNLHPGFGYVSRYMPGDHRLARSPIKAKNTNHLLFTRETFQEFPDLHITEDQFMSYKRISDVNPQQSYYNWGTIELVEWQNPEGDTQQGLLAKPENFDPTQKYPMIVNFYERSSDRLHRHDPPAPGRSTITYSYYTSNGYLIFNPDVIYKVGYPGASAYDAVVSGTKAVTRLGFVDTSRIALHGHSWGGYQIAHILTKTDMFACAEAGAPVVNMISAYGGIRWQTGLSRMFQYERTQSRLGATLWENPKLYLENSPIFEVDKINTPVLILHNDNDGHVPWYQGIEFFVAMRRLGKPAWMLNYNGEPHWPLKWANRLDFNRRLFQFFEHYLKDEPMPRWMADGVPAIHKGLDSGLEDRQ